MSKKKRSVSIKTTVVKPMVLVLFLQIVIIVLAVYFGNTTDELKKTAYSVFIDEGEIAKNNVSDVFWGGILGDSDYQRINSKLKDISITASTVDAVLVDVGKDLQKLIKDLNIDGAFIALEQEVSKGTEGKPGIYIRKDSTLRVGMLKVLKELNLKVGDLWSDTFKITKESEWEFYNKISGVIKEDNISNYRDYAYWSKPFKFGGDETKSVLYTVPLVKDDGVFYGIVGIEVSLDAINKLFNERYVSNETTSFIAYQNGEELEALALIPGDKTICNIVVTGNLKDTNDIYRVSGLPNDQGNSVVVISDLKLESNGRYIQGENIKVLTVTTEDKLVNLENQILKDLLVGIGIALVCGIIISVFTASIVTKPITKMVNNVKRMNPSKAVKIERVGIMQIDALAASIENLGKSVLDNASKLSQIIDLVNMPIGAFEYYDNSNMVYCTKSFFKVVGVEYTDDELFINMEKFKKVLADTTKDRVPNEKNVYRINQGGKEQYIRLKMSIDNQKTLGVVVDVTDDILKKKKIEFERDHDVLTGLLNRIAFKREVVNQMMNQKKDKVAAFLMWDLDSLKYINDTFGHEVGDRYIKIAADSINKFSKYGGVAGRIGGDEFTAFIGGFSTKDEVRQIINKVKRDFDAIEIELPGGNKKFMRASMGVAWYPQDSTQYEELNKYADYAMYEIKKTTKGALKEFNMQTFKADYNKYE